MSTPSDSPATSTAPDLWAKWLLESRHGADPAYEQFVRRDVERFRSRVLAGAQLAPGMTLVDVGAGDGLIAFGAIDLIGPSLRVILTDVSAPLLEHAARLAEQRGVQAQCTFLLTSAERLDGLASASADVVATRASLAYAPDKLALLREFIRVLKPGGRISLAEPVMQDEAFEACALGRLLAADPHNPDLEFLHFLHRWKSAQYPATEAAIAATPTTNFSERDLLRFARQAGFVNIHLELHLDHRLTPADTSGANQENPPASWEVFLSISPHPWAPSLRQILASRFTPEERCRFEEIMRPQIESKAWSTSEVVVYVTAQKPAV